MIGGILAMKESDENKLQKPKQSVLFGQTEITYSVNFCDRKTLAIHVYPDGQVIVDAPISASNDAIAEKVKKKASWIFKQKLQFESYPPALPLRQYVSGETFRYLGRQYRLLVKQGIAEQVKLLQGQLIVEAFNPKNNDRVKTLLQEWYRLRAKTIFSERYDFCVRLIWKLGIEHHQGFQLRFMPNRWGSCTNQGSIILNPELIAAPKDCIDYVITHELCHLKERNHSHAFYKLLTGVMKDWELRRKRLNEMVEVRFI
jgi:predicted metal-dependent hydrolase